MADSYVCSGATMRCSMGTSPAKLTVLPSRAVFLTGQPMANISDHVPNTNLDPFGCCCSLGFPATAAATAANNGILTPMPCKHNTPDHWENGKDDYFIKGEPALLRSSICQCKWGGTISIVDDGQHGEGTQWVEKHLETNYPHPHVQFTEPKTISHKSQPICIETKTKTNEIYNQKRPLASIKDNNINQLNQKQPDELILLDAYWEKDDGTKIRFIPHQKTVKYLIVVFKFMYNDDAKYDKCKAIFELTFDSPSTIFPQNKTIIIKGADVLKNKINKQVKDNAQPCYYYKIDNFSSDLSDISF